MNNETRPGSASTSNAPLLAGVLLAGLGIAGLSYANIDIVFDYSFDTNDFFSDPTRRSVLDDVASFFEATIQDDLTAIDSTATNSFNAFVSNPASGDTEIIEGFDVPADTLIVYVGARELGGSTLGQGGPGGYSIRYVDESFAINAVTRGETTTTDGVSGSAATDFAPWGGAISFDITTNWYFDDDTSTDESFSGFDFYSVALHEMAHVLGVGTSDSWFNDIDTNSGTFVGDNVLAENGDPVALADSAHWLFGTDSTVYGTDTTQEAAMDPDITAGTRKRMTDLDMAGLADIGWEVASASAQ